MKAVFLDRDGVINEDRDDYVKHLGELRIFPGAPESILRLNRAGFAVFVISNQQGVPKGLIFEEDLASIEREIVRRVEAVGARISGFYYCKHLQAEGCSCRKPQPGMLLTAAREHGVDLTSSFVIGDSEKDVVAGRKAGCRTVLVLSGNARREEVDAMPCRPDFVAADIAEAAAWIIDSSSQTE